MKNKLFLIVITIFILTKTDAANVVLLLDSVTHEPVQYASILYIQKHFGGQYSNENGRIYLPDSVNEIKITHISYFTKNIIVKKLHSDTIFLKPKVKALNEVVVYNNSDKYKKQQIGFYKAKTSNMSYGGATGFLMALYIPYNNDWHISPLISKIHGKFKFNPLIKKNYPNTLLRIDLQRKDTLTGAPDGNSLLSIPLLYSTKNIKEHATFQLPENVVFPETGVFIVLEWIDPQNNADFKNLNPLIRTTFTNQNNFTWLKRMYKGESWRKVSEDKGMMRVLNIHYPGKTSNLCFGLTILERK